MVKSNIVQGTPPSISKSASVRKAAGQREHALKHPKGYTKPFCDFLTENPTIFHAVNYFAEQLDDLGFKQLSGRKKWNSELEKGGKYYTTRNGSSLIAFTVGDKYQSGNGAAMIAGHIDALTARLKPISAKPPRAGFVQLGIAPYAGGLNETWWDRDLGIGGRVLVQDSKTGQVTTKLVKLGWPIAKVPTLAPHFGLGMMGHNDQEEQMVPVIGLESNMPEGALGSEGTFSSTQPPKLVRAIASELAIHDYSTIINWELELFDVEPARTLGLDHELISAGRIDDKLCSWSAMQALLSSASSDSSSGIIKLVALFDDEELGSLTRQGAKGNFLPGTIERIAECFTIGPSANALHAVYANSFLLSADVTHSDHPNFPEASEKHHAPRLNRGLVVNVNFQGHFCTDSVSTAVLEQISRKANQKLQYFMIRNGMRGGGTVGPMLSSAMGCRAIDVGQPVLGLHSIRSTTGALEPGLGVNIYREFFDSYEEIDREFNL